VHEQVRAAGLGGLAGERPEQHILRSQHTIERGLQPAKDIVFQFLVIPTHDAKTCAFQQADQSLRAKMEQVSRHIQMKPALAEHLGLQAMRVGHSHDIQPVISQQPCNPSNNFAR